MGGGGLFGLHIKVVTARGSWVDCTCEALATATAPRRGVSAPGRRLCYGFGVS